MMQTAAAGSDLDATARRMDRLYRWQRHIYDLTRPLILPGRNRLLAGVELPPQGKLVEIGCGTARNIVRLARRLPEASFVGVDASREMLRTAEARVASAGVSARATLRHGFAENLTGVLSGDEDRRFDAVLLSYTLSMLPTPEAVLDGAMSLLRPGGVLHLVDFWSARRWPSPLRRALWAWLALFGVAHRPAMAEWLHRMGRAVTELQEIGGGYAFLARVAREEA